MDIVLVKQWYISAGLLASFVLPGDREFQKPESDFPNPKPTPRQPESIAV